MKSIGVSYPIQRGNTGFFEATYETFSNERVKLINLLKTQEGERLMNYKFGMNIKQYIFEPITDALVPKIDTHIKSKINYWLPLIEIQNLDVNVTENRDRNIINIKLVYSVKNVPSIYDIIDLRF